MRIGVLAMQGAYKEHIDILKRLNIDAIEIRCKKDIDNIDGMIIPGGESTAMGKLLDVLGIEDKLKDAIKDGMPIWGTCAGMILLANQIDNQEKNYLKVMDICVKRNAYGRQLGSFRAKEAIKDVGDDIDMVFIRAPYIKSVGDNIDILSVVDDKIVAARDDNILVTSFHPELTEDYRMHKYFINMVKMNKRTA